MTAAVPFHRPGVAALGSRALARARWTMRGFRQLAPSRCRIPLLWGPQLRLVVAVLKVGALSVAFAMCIIFCTYIR